MTYVSLFSGAGISDWGFHLAGWDCLAQVEIDKQANAVRKRHFPEVQHFTDVNAFDCMALHHANIWHTRWEEFEEMRKNPKYDSAPARYYELKSIEAVAKEFGVSRQAMHDVLRIRGVEFYPQAREGQENHFYRGGSKAKDVAHNQLEKALKRGTVTRPTKCSLCGVEPSTFKDGRSAIQAHHEDYAKPLEVVWLCQKCHHKIHRDRYLNGLKEVAHTEAPIKIDALIGGFP